MSKIFIPPFLAKAGLRPGEWMYGSKLTVEVLLRPDFPLKVRILGCLMLQSFGYESDLAVLMKKGKYPGDKPITIPLSPFALIGMLNRAAVKAYQESKIEMTDDVKACLQVSRQNMRRALSDMEDDGLIVRVRCNTQPMKLMGLSLSEGLEKGLITPLNDLAERARKTLHNGTVCVYLLAKPRPAKSYNPVLVVRSDYQDSATSQDKAVQLAFAFVPDLKRDPARAAELVRREDARQEIEVYEKAQSNLEEAKERLRTFFVRIAAETAGNGGAAAAAPPVKQQQPLFPPPADVVSAPRKRADLSVLAQGLRDARGWHGGPIDASSRDVAQLFGHCRDGAPDCTPEEVLHRALEMLAKYHRKPLASAFGLLLTKLPPLFEGEGFQAWRRDHSTPVERKEPAPAACGMCGGSGLVGTEWNSIPEAIAAVKAGARYCECPDGGLTHDLVEPALVRSAS